MHKNSNKHLHPTTPCALKVRVAMLLALLVACLNLQAQLRINTGDDSPMRKLQIAEMAINNLYVDSVDEQKLVEDGIRGMLEKLDPHSSYTTAKETKQMNEPLQGSFEGVGIQFNVSQDTLMVIQPTLGGPSEKVGIMAGDRIVAVNDTAIAGVKMAREEMMRRLRGPKGTKVRLTVIRKGVAKLKKEGMRDLILDLQENGGGYMQSAIQIANEFLQRNDLIVYTEGRSSQRREYKAQGNGQLLEGKVMVLVNE